MIGEPILVMLVEDNVDHAELVIRTMEEHRIANKVHHFLDGQSALDYLFYRGEFSDPHQSPRPHVILLDLQLPGESGWVVLARLKDDPETARIPVIVISVIDDPSRSLALGAVAHFTKPIGRGQLTEFLQRSGAQPKEAAVTAEPRRSSGGFPGSRDR